MRASSFAPGAVVKIEDQRLILVDDYLVDGERHWAVRDENGLLGYRAEAKLRYLYDVAKTLVFVHEEDSHARTKKSGRRLIKDLPAHERKRYLFRRGLLDEVARRYTVGCTSQILSYEERNGSTHTVTVLEKFCTDAAVKIGNEVYGEARSCSVASYYRYLAAYGDGSDPQKLVGQFDNRGDRNQIDDRVKQTILDVMAEKLEEAKYRKPIGSKPVLTMREIMSEVNDRLVALNQKSANASGSAEDLFRMPSRATFYNLFRTFPAYSRAIARHGLTRARAMFRRPGEAVPVEAPLSCLQFDETRLPLFVVHDEYRIPLGRPWLAWYVDEYSRAIPGFYLGFEPPGDLVIAATTKHACLMKGYVQQEYPDIGQPYLMGGIGRHFRFDNSLQAHSQSVSEMATELDSSYEFTRSRSPWEKGLVEGAFNLVNQTFLKELPGFVLPYDQRIDGHDYDPSKHGVISFRTLVWLWHHWLLTVYHPFAPRNGSGMSRNDRWLEGIRRVRPTFLDRSADLDFLFGIVREGTWTLDRCGVVFEGLYYYSDDADFLRRRSGASQKVRVKVNPFDLLWVQVWDKELEAWIPAKARQAQYAAGLDLHTHKLLRRYANLLSGRDDVDAWLAALFHLQHLIADSVADALTIGTSAKLARAMNISTAHLFRNMQPDGRLPQDSAGNDSRNRAQQTSGDLTPGADGRGSSGQTQRPTPQFNSDLSLGNLG
ncbi:transposase family protein [Bradyrhizobium barranii subsp. barranii]|uniref:DDE-type integrase/transposase/recombinase n=1 Tax=Bradyrhizobium barranii subsp. barranii TaxID=2823807 RepID=A0A7Z0QG78_9BRAD|nr:Mu transposase C-terminal domain-containing protein [Bradyrhizobium barranii]UGX91101.1 transposase family protein [Bradyrhizobium barranii subsp. barranii]